VYVARTRNGFTPALRAELLRKMRPLQVSERPFCNLPEKRPGRWGEGLMADKAERLPVAPAGIDGPVRVPKVDRGWAFEAQQVCRAGSVTRSAFYCFRMNIFHLRAAGSSLITA
jgi:hypothetical protein